MTNISVKLTTLSAIQIREAFSNPVNVLPAPAPGTINNVLGISTRFIPGASPFDSPSNTWQLFFYGDGGATNPIELFYQNNIIGTLAVGDNVVKQKAFLKAQPILLGNAQFYSIYSAVDDIFFRSLADLPATGNGSLQVYVVYENRPIL